MSHTRCSVVILAALALMCAARAATLAEIEQAIDAQFAKVNSATYESETNMEMSQQGFSNKSVTVGKNEMQRDGAKWKMRMESKSSGTMVMAGNTTKSDSTSMMVVDGEFAYTVMDNAGNKMATKMKADIYNKSAGGKGLFDSLRESMDLTALPDENVDGKANYVVEAKPKGGVPGTSMKYYFSKDNGFSTQIVSFGPDGKPMSTTKITNVKIGAPIPADHFTFTPPAGVTVTDMTKQ